MKSRNDPSRLDVIDGLRGLAIALVVAYHCCLVYGTSFGVNLNGWGLSLDPLTKTGFLGVELFFALSGFCMFYPYAQARLRGAPLPGWGLYAYRRAIKIVPSYVLALTAFAILYAPREGLFSGTAAAYAAHLAFVHPFFPNLFQSISGPLWTIGVEVQFYLIFPLLCVRFLRSPIRVASAVVVFSAGYRAVVDATNHLDFFWTNQVVAFLDVFAAGMGAAYVVAWYRNRAEQESTARTATGISLAAAGIALYALAALSRSAAMNGDTDFFAWEAHWRLTLAAILFALVAATSLALPHWRRFVANRVCTFLAVISYNLYLWHLEILAQSQRAHLALPVAVLASLALATAVTYLLERPLLRMKLPALATRPLVEREAQAQARAA